MSTFIPVHINASQDDFEGNGDAGRYLLLPGSPARARSIAERFAQPREKPHPRGHNLHLGELSTPHGALQVGCVATGMGGPSVEIVVTELLALGARRFLRVGTAGSLQHYVRFGDLVVASAAVRDEGTSENYLPKEFPATASLEAVHALRASAVLNGLEARTHTGTVHSKDTLYAREFKRGPLAADHERYMQLLRDGGVLASEMECAALFTLAAVADAQARREDDGKRVLAGAVVGVIGSDERPFAAGDAGRDAVDAAVQVALGAIALWHAAG